MPVSFDVLVGAGLGLLAAADAFFVVFAVLYGAAVAGLVSLLYEVDVGYEAADVVAVVDLVSLL